LTENLTDYGQIVETVHLKDGTIRKIGFRSGKWIVQNRHERVAISIDGFLLYFEYSKSGRAYSYDLFNGFEEMAAKENEGLDFMVLGQVAAALGEDYVAFLD
jgi:hypothetical protein